MALGYKPKSSIGEEIIRRAEWSANTVPATFSNSLIGEVLTDKENRDLTQNPHVGAYKKGAKLINIINDRQKTFPLIVGLLNQIVSVYNNLGEKEDKKKNMIASGEPTDMDLFLETEKLKETLEDLINSFRNIINNSTLDYITFSGVDKVTTIGDIALFSDSFRQFLAADKDEATRMLAKDLMLEQNHDDGVNRTRIEENKEEIN